jgi:ubiquinone/menaquinone biosynthesis C-methylase UbiE
MDWRLWGAKAFLYTRAATYFSQLRSLQLLTGLFFKEFPTRVRDPGLQAKVTQSLFDLLNRDAARFADGTYPMSMLKPESPMSHWRRLGKLLSDGIRLQRQKRRGRTTEFSEDARDRAQEMPRYYQRNFHFQRDGYLSSESAELYEHQVEILFGGAADAMRRMVLEPLVDRFGRGDGRGLRILEIGAGTGRTSRMIRALYPKAHLTISELSDPYLKHARRRLDRCDRVDFVQCAGEALPFQAAQFDAVVSVFLFHELPHDIRVQVLEESMRVLKPGGVLAAVDSIQRHDAPEWSPMLDQFPVDFHEPFYRNYLDDPLEDRMRGCGANDVASRTGFVSKLVWGSRPT